jgi:hypothetical protein
MESLGLLPDKNRIICHLQLLVQSRNLLAPDSPPAVEKDLLPEPVTEAITIVHGLLNRCRTWLNPVNASGEVTKSVLTN